MNALFKLVLRVALLALPALRQAQFTFTTNNGTLTITGYDGPGGAVSLPAAFNSLPVTGIGDNAFGSCTNLANVTIPASITSIGPRAFYFCTNLTNITIGTSVTSLGPGVCSYCWSLPSFVIPASVTSIGDHAFYDPSSTVNRGIGEEIC